MDFSKFLQLNYWFNSHPLPLHSLQKWILIVVFSILILSGVAILIISFKKEKFLRTSLNKISTAVFVMGGLGWLLFFLRQAGVYFLSARFWLIVWLIGLIFWLWRLIHYFKKVYPLKKEEIRKEKQLKKYLP